MSYYCGSVSDSQDHTIFLVGQDEHGHHFVHENHGLIGGDFVTRDEALRFARSESRAAPGSIVVVAPEIPDWHPSIARLSAVA